VLNSALKQAPMNFTEARQKLLEISLEGSVDNVSERPVG
jgi:hypothetical protein